MGSILGAISDDENDWNYLVMHAQDPRVPRETKIRLWESSKYIAGTEVRALEVLMLFAPDVAAARQQRAERDDRDAKIQFILGKINELSDSERDELLSTLAITTKKFWNE